MSHDSDLYGEDIHLWSERQGALLRRLSAGEAITDQVDWPHVVGEIEELRHSHAQHSVDQNEIARLTKLLNAAEARVKELRSRLDDLTERLADTQAELATARDLVEAANARVVVAAKAEEAIRQADAERRAKGVWARLWEAWRGK